ncbi:prenyltransferase/squalene oxidase repeat-containing protein [Candidatus Uabimicrobium sp. HlEnr_7]|uniref:prenyltransferase/squalene oxidase repeat-containing protein n=1 Tax=Candidatus Uabimicrobium helgolandensis TaxID=3095367 RepID=UPI0035563A0A
MDTHLLNQAAQNTLSKLQSLQVEEQRWIGELAPSALSTATAICALSIVDFDQHKSYIEQGAEWLARNVNEDGGWGDTPLSLSNISTTCLVWAAFGAAKQDSSYPKIIADCEKWICNCAGGLKIDDIIRAISDKYGKDKTFAIPILTMCTLSGRFGDNKRVWRCITQLPFELAAFPHQFFSFLRLPVVSYALPALIAIGQVRHHLCPTRNPLTYLIRRYTVNKTLKKLNDIQPTTGGYLEAIPLTSFVAMSVASYLTPQHPSYKVVDNCVSFLKNAMRKDGSWPIDINLTVWGTTLSINSAAISTNTFTSFPNKQNTLEWLLQLQQKEVHPFTNAAPGGWAWIDLSGGVPDADDTPGALIALSNLAPEDERVKEAARKGVVWLLDLQNSDGGIPTFCRGWGTLPFDRSTPDLTAHTLSAWSKWYSHLDAYTQKRVKKATQKCLTYLQKNWQTTGGWLPLWFGNQHAPNQENPVYGTARVLIALIDIELYDVTSFIAKARSYLLEAQHENGGWGGDRKVRPSIEETALALHALAKLGCQTNDKELTQAISQGEVWLRNATKEGKHFPVTPIGLYYASLWYYEQLYPIVFSLGAFHQIIEYRKG